MSTFVPSFTITNSISRTLSRIDQAKGFLDAATLSENWLNQMRQRALMLEAHHTTHIEGTHLTLEQSEKLLAGEKLQNIDPEDERELRNYIDAFDYVEQHIKDNTTVTEKMILEIHRRLVVGVRESNMNLTGWLEYFTSGLSVQMIEIVDRGRQAIRKELISKKYNLSNRQELLVGYLLEHLTINVQDAEVICPGVNRRTLQRDLADLIDRGIITREGSTNLLVYRLDE